MSIQAGFEIAEWPSTFTEGNILWMYNYAGTNLVAYETREYHPDEVTGNKSRQHLVAIFKQKKKK